MVQRHFYTADLHLGHANVIKYCNRPFANVDEMDQALLENWRKTVSKNDVIHVLGDLSFHRDSYKVADIVHKLPGQKHLVLGNHDSHLRKDVMKTVFSTITDLKEMKVRDNDSSQMIVMCHYSLRVWNASHYGSLHAHGHSHGNMPPLYGQLDVGVDNAYKLLGEYRPFSFDEFKMFALSNPKPEYFVDHHREKGA